MLPRTSPWRVVVCTITPCPLIPTQLVELKNGETFNGHLVNCDNFMNITLREVYQTNTDATRFWKLKECYIRGSTVCILFLTPPLVV
jgi:small nuclear ribonucleoprotein (snRNP)-like protein